MSQFQAVHPVLSVRDVLATSRFFQDVLAFTPAFDDGASPPLYAGLRREGVEVHLQWHSPGEWKAGLDAAVYRFLVSDPDALFAEVSATGHMPAGKQVSDTTWGTREFGLYDPDKNGLFFYRDL